MHIALNTMIYMGGTPYDATGDETYVCHPWDKKTKITSLHFFHISGEAPVTRLEIWDRNHSEVNSHKLTEFKFTNKEHKLDLDLLIESYRPRLYLRLIGSGTNHCMIMIDGESAE